MISLIEDIDWKTWHCTLKSSRIIQATHCSKIFVCSATDLLSLSEFGQDSREIRGVLWTLSGTYVAWRITFGFWKKLGRRTQQNINSKAELEHKYGKVSERIDVMHQLLERGDSDQQLSKSLKG